MPYMQKYREWIRRNNWIRHEYYKRKVLVAMAVAEIIRVKVEERQKRRKRKLWMHPLLQLRATHGFYENVYPHIRTFDDKHSGHYRLSVTQLEDLLCIIGPRITKQQFLREPISAKARLLITLR